MNFLKTLCAWETKRKMCMSCLRSSINQYIWKIIIVFPLIFRNKYSLSIYIYLSINITKEKRHPHIQYNEFILYDNIITKSMRLFSIFH